MRNRTQSALPRRYGFSLFFTLLSLIGISGPALRGETTSAHSGSLAAVEEALRGGLRLESEQRWGEALQHYEDLLRRYPGENRVERRANLARTHLEVARRYADPSYLATVRTLREDAALELCGDVLRKIESHYVDQPDWNALVTAGLDSVDVALREPGILAVEPRCRREQTAEFSKLARAEISRYPLRQDRDAVNAIGRVARLANQRVGVSTTTCVLECVSGIVHGLDDYSSFLTPNELREVYSQIEGDFVGLGIELKADQGALLVVKVIPGSPADQGGLRPDDRIIYVDGRSTSDTDNDRAADLLQGPEGSLVDLVVIDGQGVRKALRIRRAHVEIPSVERPTILDADRGVAYLQLTSFQKSTAEEVDRALWDLHRQGMKSVILDVRGNPGGLLTAAVDLVDKFVQRGVIVSTRGRNRDEDFNYTASRTGTWRVPLVVLIDRDSASASEIFAGAIRDHGRGVIVGEKSYGKGSVQGIFPLSTAGTGLRLTTAKFYSPSGRAISHQGVIPHVDVQSEGQSHFVGYRGVSSSNQDADPVLARAIQVARDAQSTAAR